MPLGKPSLATKDNSIMQQPPYQQPPQQPYQQPPYQQYPQQPPQKSGMGWVAKIFIGLGVMTALGFAGCALCVGGAAKSVSDQAAKEQKELDSQTAKDVTADEIVAAYAKNEVAGDAEYKGKKLRISGTIDSIESGAGDEPRIELKTKEAFKHVTLEGIPKAEAAKLEKGAAIKAECKGDGEIMGFPKLSKCKLL